MRKELGCLVFLASLAPVVSRAANRYVDARTGSDSGPNADCLVPTSPCKTIAHALGLTGLRAGDRILVSPGDYGAALGERFPLVLKQGVELIAVDGPSSTRILGSGTGGPSTVQITLTGRSTEPTGIQGFTLDGGGAPGARYGVFLETVAPLPGPGEIAPYVRDCRLKGFRDFGVLLLTWGCCTATSGGNAGLGAVVERNFLEGAGISIQTLSDDGSSTSTDRSMVRNNVVVAAPTGVFLLAGMGTMATGLGRLESRIRHNTVVGSLGDGILLAASDEVLPNPPRLPLGVEVSNNVLVSSLGYGIHEDERYQFADVNELHGNLIHGNARGGYYDADSRRAWSTQAEIDAIPDLQGRVDGNLVEDPRLEPTTRMLTAQSPCRDAGHPLFSAPDDFQGDVRPVGAAPDMGADEYVSFLRGVFTRLSPPEPSKQAVFGALPAYDIPGPRYIDPEPNILTNDGKPLVAYGHPTPGTVLFAIKEPAGASVEILY